MSHSQPKSDQAYEAQGNAVSKDPTESRHAAEHNKASSENVVEEREGGDLSSQKAKPTPLAQGIHGAPPSEGNTKESNTALGQSGELDAEQMAAPGEGRVRDAVNKKPGATGAEPELTSDLDRKKAEQKDARESIKADRREGVDVGGVLGDRGGPASAQ